MWLTFSEIRGWSTSANPALTPQIQDHQLIQCKANKQKRSVKCESHENCQQELAKLIENGESCESFLMADRRFTISANHRKPH
jgi:hypothetical protein